MYTNNKHYLCIWRKFWETQYSPWLSLITILGFNKFVAKIPFSAVYNHAFLVSNQLLSSSIIVERNKCCRQVWSQLHINVFKTFKTHHTTHEMLIVGFNHKLCVFVWCAHNEKSIISPRDKYNMYMYCIQDELFIYFFNILPSYFNTFMMIINSFRNKLWA